jgi:hypothetical protein
MASPSPGKLTLPDLSPVIDIVAGSLTSMGQARTAVTMSEVSGVRFPVDFADAKELWIPVFQAALDGPDETLAKLLNYISGTLGAQSKVELENALRTVGIACVSRITRINNSKLADEAGALLEASDVPNMQKAATELRRTALNIRRLLMRPVLTDKFLQLAPTVLDPEFRRMELADLAVDVVTATDYLLSLLGAPASLSSRLVLDAEAGSDRGHGTADIDALDRLNRRRLDARSTAVRLGMRLLGALRSDVANPL